MTILSVKYIIYSVVVLVAALLFNFSSNSDMQLGEKQVLLSKSLDETFEIVGDLEKFSEWFPGVAGFMEIETGPKTRGKRYRETVDIPLYGNVYYVHILWRYDSPRTVEFMDDSWLHLRYKFTFSQHEPFQGRPRTMLEIKITSRLRTYWFQLVAAPFFKFMYDQRLRSAAFNVRYLVDHY